MKNKPITPAMHGLTDYIFALALLTVPWLLGCNKKTVQLYRLIAAEVFFYGTLTKQPLGLLPIIPMKAHRAIDLVNLAGLSLFTGFKGIRKNTKAKIFNVGMVGLGLSAVLLTRWRKRHF